MNGRDIARDLIEDHEGRRGKVYECSQGKMTVGVGHNLESRPLNNAEIDMIFAYDLDDAESAAKSYAYYGGLDAPRQAALMDMAFQLGAHGLSRFKRMHTALGYGDYALAANECLDSLYAVQTPQRAYRIATIIESGVMF